MTTNYGVKYTHEEIDSTSAECLSNIADEITANLNDYSKLMFVTGLVSLGLMTPTGTSLFERIVFWGIMKLFGPIRTAKALLTTMKKWSFDDREDLFNQTIDHMLNGKDEIDEFSAGGYSKVELYLVYQMYKSLYVYQQNAAG